MKTLTRSTNILALTRSRLGLTQLQMAMHLGISHSMVKQVETNRRHLQHDKLVKLAALEIEVAGVKKKDTQRLPVSVKEIYTNAQAGYELETKYQEARCRHKATMLEKRLKKMQFEHQLITGRLHNLDAMAGLELNGNDPLLRSLQQSRPRLVNKLLRCNQQLQATIKNRIVLLHAEAALNRSILPEYVHNNEKPIHSSSKQTNMDYTVSRISSKADCQAMIDTANDDKDALVYRKTGLQRQMQSASASSVGIDSDLAAVSAELDALQTIIDTLPDGAVKEDNKVKFTKAEYKKFLLEQRRANYGSVALVEKEYNLGCVDQSIGETDALIAALAARMTELTATP